MQKVEGSNPFSRFARKPRSGGPFLGALHLSASFVLGVPGHEGSLLPALTH
jgi:hypothetical protein